MVSLFLVLDIFIDMIYIAIIGLELYFYITFDKDYIEDTIGNLFNDFINYILKTTIVKEEGYLPYLIVNENDIETEEIIIDYKFKRLQRIYESIKYYKYSYQLDVQSIWDQIKEYNYPKVYC